jgi:carbon storage regulator
MLVLSRQRDETIMIGDDIEVTVVDIRGDKVRLGINAPKEIAVHRKEVYEAIRRENRDSAQIKPEDISGLKPPHPPATQMRGPRPASMTPPPQSPSSPPPPPSGPAQASKPEPPPATDPHTNGKA